MLLRELLESTSIESSLLDVISAVNYVRTSNLYGGLINFINDYYDNKGTTVGLPLLLGGQKSAAFQRLWVGKKSLPGLQALLTRHFVPELDLKIAKPLKKFLHYSHKIEKLDDLEGLPNILAKIGKQLVASGNNDAEGLVRAANNWNEDITRFYSAYEAIKEKVRAEKEGTPAPTTTTPKAAKKPKNELLGAQNTTLESTINEILNRIPKKHRAEIRMIVNRSGNKLKTLQDEIAKRNIKLQD